MSIKNALFILLNLTISLTMAATHHYKIEIDSKLSTLKINACFGNKNISGLLKNQLSRNQLGHLKPHALHLLKLLTFRTKNSFKMTADEIQFKYPIKNDCIDYQVNLNLSTALFSDSHFPYPHFSYQSKAKVIAPYYWLWLPKQYSDKDSLLIHFNFPKDIHYSVPWPTTIISGKKLHLHDKDSAEWAANTVFGRFKKINVTIGGSTLRVAILNPQQFKTIQTPISWIKTNALAVSTLFGKFPRQSTQILVMPIGHQREAVPFAQVLRGGAPSIHLYIDPHRPLSEFISDWTLAHEMSHLFLPFVQRQDAWLSEGLASYYQNILRARTQLITNKQAWQKLHEGFQRGRNSLKDSRLKAFSLRQASNNMRKLHAYMRVYWSGAAIILLADLELRKKSNGSMTLDLVLKRLQKCCMQIGYVWRGDILMNKMDELSHSKVFSSLYKKYALTNKFPNLRQAYKDLGLQIDAHKQIIFNHNAPYAKHRQHITNRSNPP